MSFLILVVSFNVLLHRQSPNSPLFCCFLFQFTSSNMSKNVLPPLLSLKKEKIPG